MAKKVTGQVKLQIPAGKATPAPPVGTALGPQGVNIMDFCKAYNAKTSGKDQEGLIIPVVITIYSDRSFTFITKTPPVPVLIKRAVNIAKGSAEPHKTKVGEITEKQIEEIAKIKLPDLNTISLESAMKSRPRHRPQHGRHRSLNAGDLVAGSSSCSSVDIDKPRNSRYYRLHYREGLPMPRSQTFLAAVFLLLYTSAASAQVGGGSIIGIVRDPSGAPCRSKSPHPQSRD